MNEEKNDKRMKYIKRWRIKFETGIKNECRIKVEQRINEWITRDKGRKKLKEN